MAKSNFENLQVFRLAESLSDQIWDIVRGWDAFERNTVGKQIVRSADSIGANIAEGSGRGSFQDNRRFVKIAGDRYRKPVTGCAGLLPAACSRKFKYKR